MLIYIGILIEFVLIMLLMGFFINYARAKANESAFLAKGDNVRALQYQYKKEKYSRLWHGTGLIMRVLFVAIVIINSWPDWYRVILDSLIAIFFSWQVFDRGINIVMENSFWYVDSKNINKALGKLYWAIAGLLLGGIVSWAIFGQNIIN